MQACCHCGVLAPKTDLIQLPKNKVTLQNWIKKYNLNIVEKRDGQFICKSHTTPAEKVKEELPPTISYNEPSTSDSYFYDVKQEEVDETEYMNSWVEPKIEQGDEEVNYDDVPFEMEENSYETFDDETYNYQQNGYEMNRQPSTSTPSTSRGIVHPSKTETDDLSNLRLCYPELSDEQVMSFCVKTSSNLSGESSFECGMCPEQYFENTDTRPIRLHLEMRHHTIMDNFIKTGRAYPDAPKQYATMSPKTKAVADETLCKFLIKNGLPLRTVKDPNLEMLTFNMNSSYNLPSIDKLSECLQQIALNRMNMEIIVEDGPINVTFDTTSFDTRHFLAFTLHYYQNGNQRKQSIFLREFKMTESPVSSIMSIIKKTISDCNIRLPINTVVSGRTEYKESLEDMGDFKNVFLCFSEKLKEFVDSITKEVFDKPLKKLRNFIRKFPNNRSDWSRFKAYVVRKRTYGEYPEVDNEDNWFTTVDFITKCLHMHRLFSEFSRTNNAIEYIDVEDNINIVYLHSLLNLCKLALRMVVDSRTSIAEVIPAIAEIGGSLHISTTQESIVAAVHHRFKRILCPFVERSDIHRFAVFLHPRRHRTPILTNADWNSIKASLTRTLAIRKSNIKKPINMVVKTNRIAPFNDEECEREMADYCAYIGRVTGVESEIVDWWARHSSRFPLLYEFAKEIYLIPALSIDASFYLGDCGLLTYSFNETEDSNRKMLLEASSELVEFRSKGEIMNKLICVKRKRETACAEDMWYTPIDTKSAQYCQTSTYHPQQTRTLQNQTLSSAALSTNRIYLSSKGQPPRPSYQPPPVARKSLKDAVAHIPRPLNTYNRVNRPPSHHPYARPVIMNKSTNLFPVKTETIKTETRNEMKVPTTTKKYFAVKTIPSNGQRLIRTMDGRLVQVVTRPNPQMVINPIQNGKPNPQGRKVYFIRSKNGVTQQLQKVPQ